jgi:hypothetical protein
MRWSAGLPALHDFEQRAPRAYNVHKRRSSDAGHNVDSLQDDMGSLQPLNPQRVG